MRTLVHIAAALLASGPVISGAAPDATPALPTISIDLAALDRTTFEALKAADIYQGLVLRLVNEKVALVSPHEQADFVLRFLSGANEGELRIVASNPAVSRQRVLSLGSLARLNEEAVQLELIHAAVELVRQVQGLTPPRPVKPKPQVQRLRADLTTGALWTGGTTGVLVRLAGTRSVGPAELGLGLAVHRPLSLPASLSVTEWGAFAVVGTGERALGARMRAATGLDLGIWQHRWRYASAGPSDSGAHLDAAALLHGGVAWRLSPSWRTGITAGFLWTSRPHVHRDTGGTLWQAPSFRPFAGFTLTLGSEGENR
jgi:hypothetical protein